MPAPGLADDQTDSSLLGQLARAGHGWGIHGSTLDAAGRRILIDNPILKVLWQPSVSAWTGKGGFRPGLTDRLLAGGIEIGNLITAIPDGSITRTPGQRSTIGINLLNGDLARDAVADSWREKGYRVETEQRRAGQRRRVDVVVHQPAADPRYDTRWEIESKVGETDLKPFTRRQVDRDIAALANNKSVRRTGEHHQSSGRTLRNISRVARPLGIAMDALDLGSAYQSDGNRIGENTKRTASGIAGGALGGWGGTAAGATLGTMFLPGVGTVVGGLLGGLTGAYGGDLGGRWLFNNYDRRLSADEIPPSLSAPMP